MCERGRLGLSDAMRCAILPREAPTDEVVTMQGLAQPLRPNPVLAPLNHGDPAAVASRCPGIDGAAAAERERRRGSSRSSWSSRP